MPSRLTKLQERVLELLAGVDPRWTLTGGAALAAVHLGHRPTRDLDLFWHGLEQLGGVRDEVAGALRRAGLDVECMQAARSFARLRVSDGQETLMVDLVADPVATIEAPAQAQVGGARILIDTPHEILVNKLCALLSRAELRDLQDVRALLDGDADLERALAEAPRKDGGFSPLTLAWLVRDLPLASMAGAADLAGREARELEQFREQLVARIVRAAAPGPEPGD